MKSIFLVCLAVLAVGVMPAYADTHVGPITYSSNVTWLPSGSPYIIDGEIDVNSGVTLAIGPGVYVKFSGDYGIIVSGTINAQGYSYSKIHFQSNVANKNHGYIKVTGGLGNFKYCDFSYLGASGIVSALEFSSTSAANYVDRCNFTRDSSYWAGGAITISGSAANVRNCNFNSNYGCRAGGAMNIQYITSASTAHVDSNTFVGNITDCTTRYYGAGGAIATDQYETGTISYNQFIENSAYIGGAIASQGLHNLVLKYNLFVKNQAYDAGGGIYLAECNSGTLVTNNTLVHNGADQTCGGIYCDYTVGPLGKLKNNILWENNAPDAPQIIGGLTNVSYSDIQGGYPGGSNIINIDPQFLDSDDDFHLQCQSPCIDAGDTEDPHDYDFTYIDQGCYYFQQMQGSGDANNNCRVTVDDQTFINNYLHGGPTPSPYWKADANGDCSVSGLDVTYLTAYFSGGPAPRKKTSCSDPRWSTPDSCGECSYY